MGADKNQSQAVMMDLPSCHVCMGRDSCFLASGASEESGTLRAGIRAIALGPGEIAFSEGEMPSGVWLVCRGRMSVIKRLAGGDQVTLRISYPGDLVGYRSFFAGQPFQASAIALGSSVLLFLDRSFMDNLVGQSHGASVQLLRKLSRDLGHAEAIVTTIDQKDARLRVLRLLRDLRGLKDGGATAKWLRLPVRPHDISVLVGLPFDMTFDVLNELQTEGVVLIENNHLSILNSLNGSAGTR